jgi:uncharacterized protein (UPF0303 family)
MTDLPVVTIQELEELERLDLGFVDNELGVDLGLVAVELITERGLNLAVEVIVSGDVVFRAKLGSTNQNNDPWLTGKALVAEHFGAPSLLVRRRLEAAGESVADHGLDPDIFRAHGGSIPLRAGGTVVGTLTLSGEPDVVDHAVAADVIRRYLDN